MLYIIILIHQHIISLCRLLC